MYVVVIICLFFFKQKTAYEMRISDWRSDVCSSDLPSSAAASAGSGRRAMETAASAASHAVMRRDPGSRGRSGARPSGRHDGGWHGPHKRRSARWRAGRSEEHTSELQSLMRISYAVFCLKKKKTRRKERKEEST